MHPAVCCFGETLRVAPALEEGRVCGCGDPIPDCDFWRPLLPRLEAETRFEPRRFRPETFRWLAQARDADLAVDLSKTLAWSCARRWRDPGVGWVLMLRDPRGHMASTVRRGVDPGRQLRMQRKWVPRMGRLVRARGERGLVLYHGELCRSPRAELERLCGFLGLGFDERMLRPADQPHHFMHSSESGYLKGTNEIRGDERWRTELEPKLRSRVERMMQRVELYAPYLEA